MAFSCLFAQESRICPFSDYGQVINSHNAKGQKEGLWISDWEELTSFRWFHNGQREGLSFAWYDYSNTIDQIEFFHQDSPVLYVGVDEQGHISCIMVCGDNSEFNIMNLDGSLYLPDYKSYCKHYYPNGRVESEGVLVWNRGDEIVFGDQVKCGVWKYYDQEGSITTKKYPLGNMKMNSPEKRLGIYKNEPISDDLTNKPERNNSKASLIPSLKPCRGSSFDFGQVINQYDSLGRKSGLWIESDGDYVLYGWYFEGRKNGIALSLRVSTNTLSWFDYYVNGDLKALIRLCDGRDSNLSFSVGSVLSIHMGIINNDNLVVDQEGTPSVLYNKAYTKYFYPDRQIRSEGILVWDKEGSLLMDSKACGEWKFYDKDGRLTIENY